MADVYTGTGTITGPPAATGLSTVQAAYDRSMFMSLRARLFYDDLATVEPTMQDKPGLVVNFTIYDDLADSTAELGETTDVEVVALSDSQTSVTIREYGNAVLSTAKLRGSTFDPTFSPHAANIVGRNAAQSIDTICRDVLHGGTNVSYISQTARASLVATNTITASAIREQVANLRAANVDTWDDRYFGSIHPHVSVDLRENTGGAGWTDPVNYSDAQRRWKGEIGTFEGVSFVETPRSPIFADGGAGTVDAYATLIVGKEAMAKAYSSTVSAARPQVVLGPVTDRLKRFVPVGWYWMGGYARFREEALRRIESASSIGANA